MIDDDAKQVGQLIDALASCVARASDYGTQDEGDFVAFYLLPTGPIHRAIALLQQHGINVRPGQYGGLNSSVGRVTPEAACADLRAARERLCRAQVVVAPEASKQLQRALDEIDRVGVFFCPDWSRFSVPELLAAHPREETA